MEGRADRQQDAALGALFAGDRDCPLDRGPVAADHHLTRRIVVGAGADLALGRRRRDLLGRRQIQPQQRRHGARPRPAPPAAWRGPGASAAAPHPAG